MFRQASNADPSDSAIRGNYLRSDNSIYYGGNPDQARALAMQAVRSNPDLANLVKGDLALYNQAIAARNRTATEQQQRQFAAGEQGLLDEMRPVHATPVVAKAAPKPHREDGYVPNPTARLDAVDPRDYPVLSSYTKDQRIAHDMNHDGIEAVELHHDWATAMSSFAAAYDYDPAGPFSKVIRENMTIAAKHLDAQRAQRLAATAGNVNSNASARTNPSTAAALAANAAAKRQAAKVKQVLPKTYAECNAEFQSRTNTCQHADGSWDREGCFDPAKTRFDGCVKGLTEASFR